MSKRDKNSARGTRTDILNAKNKAKRKRSILGSKMYAQSISFTPKNGSSSRNDLSFNQTNGIDWKIFADKVKMYISKLSELINQKVNHNENAASNEKSLSEFKQLTWSKVKFSKNLDQLVENMFGDQNGYESMLQRVHHKQHQFYCSTNDEYRGYSDVQTFINENKANGSFNKSDSNENSAEKEYLVEMSKMIKNTTKQESVKARPRSNIKQYERLFNSDHSRLNREFIQMSKIIKDSGRVEFSNQMFNDVFEAVCHPESIKQKK